MASTKTSESVVKILRQSAALNTLDQLSQMKDQDQKFSPELHRQQLQLTRTKQGPIWNDRNITLSSKIIRLMRLLEISILLHACESWTLTAELERRIQTIEMKMLSQAPRHLIQRSHHKCRGTEQNHKGNGAS